MVKANFSPPIDRENELNIIGCGACGVCVNGDLTLLSAFLRTDILCNKGLKQKLKRVWLVIVCSHAAKMVKSPRTFHFNQPASREFVPLAGGVHATASSCHMELVLHFPHL